MKASAQINRLIEISMDKKDHATRTFLRWFVEAQVREEVLTREVVQHLKLVGDGGNGVFLIDSEMGRRPDRVDS